MSNNRFQHRQQPVRIIDHEPLKPSQHSFGKRASSAGRTGEPERSGNLPFEKNGISTYFTERVRARQKNEPGTSAGMRNQGAIRTSRNAEISSPDEPGLPYAALAAVFALAIAIPAGFIWLTELSSRPGLDRITTASVGASRGLAVKEVNMTRILKNGTFVVTVSGHISNMEGRRKSLMPLTISLLDKDGVEVQSWRHAAGTGILKPDGTLFFNTSAIDFSGRAATAHVSARTIR